MILVGPPFSLGPPPLPLLLADTSSSRLPLLRHCDLLLVAVALDDEEEDMPAQEVEEDMLQWDTAVAAAGRQWS